MTLIFLYYLISKISLCITVEILVKVIKADLLLYSKKDENFIRKNCVIQKVIYKITKLRDWSKKKISNIQDR